MHMYACRLAHNVIAGVWPCGHAAPVFELSLQSATFFDGCSVGERLGIAVGLSVGVTVGGDVGRSVGCWVGRLVGSSVGVSVGLVGDGVGIFGNHKDVGDTETSLGNHRQMQFAGASI